MFCRICKQEHGRREVWNAIEVERCANCLGVQTQRVPSVDELKKYYSDAWAANYSGGMESSRYTAEMTRRFRFKARYMQRYLRAGAAVLDVGAADGLFMQLASEAGFAISGVDYVLNSKLPAHWNVQVGQIDVSGGIPFPSGKFDAVTMWAVIEHVRDPWAAIAEAKRLLKPGGYLFMDTPLVGNVDELLVAARSHWICPPEHIHLFSGSSLRALVTESGLELMEHVPSFEYSVARWYMRRARNFVVGTVLGGGMRLLRPSRWNDSRRLKETSMGDIQFVVGKVPTS